MNCFEHKNCSVQKVKSKGLELITALSSKQALWTTPEGRLGINYAADFIGTCEHSDITPLGVSFLKMQGNKAHTLRHSHTETGMLGRQNHPESVDLHTVPGPSNIDSV